MTQMQDMDKKAQVDVIVNTIFTFLAVAVVCLRFYSRLLTRARICWDDGFNMLSALLVVALLIEQGFLSTLGLGYTPFETLELGDVIVILQLLRAFRFTFIFCICAIKLSALFLYIRIFVTNTMRRVCKWSIAIVLAWTISNLVQEALVCSSEPALGPDGLPPSCKQRQQVDIALCVSNAVSDIVVLLLPIWPVWKLQMKTSTKVHLTGVILLGLAATIIAILRLCAIVSTSYDRDLIQSVTQSISYAVLEPALAAICVALPSIQPIFRKLREKVFLRRQGRSTRTHLQSLSNSSPRDKRSATRLPSEDSLAYAGYSRAEPTPGAITLASHRGPGYSQWTAITAQDNATTETGEALELKDNRHPKRNSLPLSSHPVGTNRANSHELVLAKEGIMVKKEWAVTESRLSPSTSS